MGEGCCSWNYWILGGISLCVLYAVGKYLKKTNDQKKREKWNGPSEHKVILHGIYGGNKSVPSPSPFVLKLETFLRLAKIDYEIDKQNPFGPKGKSPWISYKGEHMGDSQFIVEELEKKFGTNFGKHYTDEEKAVATMVRVVLEEHVYWGGVMWRFVYGGRDTFSKVLNGNEITFGKWLLFKFIGSEMKKMAWSQGMGRHSEDEITRLMIKDLRAISKILGKKKYILGDEITVDDCAIFGFLATGVMGSNPHFENILQDECNNLKEYCLRIKSELWPDWDKCLDN